MKKILFTVLFIMISIMISSRVYASNINVYDNTVTFSAGAGYEKATGYFGDNFESGISANLSFQYLPPRSLVGSFFWWRYYYYETAFKYLSMDMSVNPRTKIYFYTFDIGPVLFYPLFSWLNPFIGGSIGGFYSVLDLDALDKKDRNTNILYRAKGGFVFPATSSLSFKAEGSYNYLKLDPDPYKSYSVALSASYNFSGDYGNQLGKKEAAVQIIRREVKDIFGIRYMQYNAQGLGSITVKNSGSESVYNVRIDTIIDEIYDGAKETEEIAELKAGDARMLLLPAAISTKIFDLSEDKKLSIKYRVTYSTGSSKYYYSDSDTLNVYSKNALTWDNTATFGSFIMPRDETVSSFARRVISESKDSMINGISRKLVTAMALFNSLHVYGITYVSDPRAGYSSGAGSKGVDYVQLPAETLRKKAGDCDDLTALYASMLEGVGIATAIATIPGHVFMAFNTEVPESSANEISSDRNDYIIRGGTVWIPVEITRLNDTFMKAWKDASREAQGSGFALYETVTAWQMFPPSDMGKKLSVGLPDFDKLAESNSRDIAAVKINMYDSRVSEWKKIVEKDPKNVKGWNNLGIVYGRFQQVAEAEECFKKALGLDPGYDPALTNMGNIFMLKKDYPKAAEYYGKALDRRSDNNSTRINYARALYEMRNFAKASEEYRIASSKDPGYTSRYKYLSSSQGDNTTRADDITERDNNNLWNGAGK